MRHAKRYPNTPNLHTTRAKKGTPKTLKTGNKKKTKIDQKKRCKFEILPGVDTPCSRAREGGKGEG